MCTTELRADSVKSFLECVDKIYEKVLSKDCKKKRKHLFFRGHSQYSYRLLPSIFRDDKQNEKEILLDFYHYGPQHRINYDFDLQRVNILTDMQHNEIPTRLLDWSFAPLNALFFAVSKIEKNNSDDPVVYVFNPWGYNSEIIDYGMHPRIHDVHVHARALLSSAKGNINYIKNIIERQYGVHNFPEESIKEPIAFVSNFTNGRIYHQRGAFTIHGTENLPLDSFTTLRKYLCEIVIDKSKSQEILDELNKLYINHYSIYPDFMGMRDQIKNKNGLFNL